jgi:hypothetical protein
MNQFYHTNDSLSWPRLPRWILAVGGLWMLAQTGCPSDSKGPSPQTQCEALADDICDKLVSCYGELTGDKPSEKDRQACLTPLKADCKNAVGVDANYPKCVDSIHDATCDDVFSVNDDGDLEANDLPSVCEDVILTH